MSRSRRNTLATLLLVGLAPLLAGCAEGGTDPAEDGLTTSEFVEIVTALREAEREVSIEDSAGTLFAERKAEILERRGVTEAELRAFVVALGQDPVGLEQVWDTIAERLKYLPEEREPVQREVQGGPSSESAPADSGEQRLH